MADRSAAATCYLAELYAPRHDPDRLSADTARLRAAAGALAEAGLPVRYLHSAFVAAEETVFHVFEAESGEAVEQALRDAGLEAERISAAVAVADEPAVLRSM